jgi:hypothetical protein
MTKKMVKNALGLVLGLFRPMGVNLFPETFACASC